MKVLCIVQARMGSERLPGKVMREINGKPMISYTLNSLEKSKYIDEIVLATSTLEINDQLAEYVESINFNVFRGENEDNVLERYKLVADKYEGDVIIRVTGDCPLINPIIVDNVVTKFLMYDYDYVRLDVPDTFQRGFDVEVFSKKALDKVYSRVCSDNIDKEEYKSFREHVTLYIYNHQDEFNVGYVKGEGKYFENRQINLSVDTEDDFRRIEELFRK